MESTPQVPHKRTSKSCKRCHRRKQRCHGFPICSNCHGANQPCIQSEFSLQLHRNNPGFAAYERIRFLETQLANALSSSPEASRYRDSSVRRASTNNHDRIPSPLNGTLNEEPRPVDHVSLPPERTYDHNVAPVATTHSRADSPSSSGNPLSGKSACVQIDQQATANIADTVGFLILGNSIDREPTYVGSSSGVSVAANLGQIVQATVWTKALSSTISEQQPKPLSLNDLIKGSSGPPNDEMGLRIIDAYYRGTHPRYPFLDRLELLELHAGRYDPSNTSPQERFGTFKLYMVYAIGATMLQLTGSYDYTSPEKFFMAALQYISAARESHSIHNIEAMALLVLYSLRSPSNSGIWYMVGLAMRTAVDLGLHREEHYRNITPYKSELRRRLFWSIYLLERVVALSLGRPFSIADRDIDTKLPFDFDDSTRDDDIIAQTLANPSTSMGSRPTTNLTLWINYIQIKRFESRIQSTVYRVDKPVSSLFPKVASLLSSLETWERNLPNLTVSENDYTRLQWNKAIQLLLQPFLSTLNPHDKLIERCLKASGQICEIFKRMHQRDSYGHSFIAVHSTFMAGVTMW
jgi:Fungal specific transcription factor domain/Fungal Zn(2)-Cys(6) binuclear cluster domain